MVIATSQTSKKTTEFELFRFVVFDHIVHEK